MATKIKLKVNGRCVISQFDHNDYSHKGSWAWDIASKETNKYLGWQVNVPVVCKAINKAYGTVWWQTQEPVEWANGDVDYMVIMACHDDTMNAYVGMKINANIQLGNMGTKSASDNVTGVHTHFEIGKGKYAGTWYKNEYGVYILYNSVPIYDAVFMDDMQFQTPKAELIDRWNEEKVLFRYTTDETEDTPEPETPETSEGDDDGVNGLIDVSSWQPTIDYAKVAKNTKGAILRCGRTGYGTAKEKKEDSTFKKHYEGFKKAGLPVGAYYYSCAVTEDEARKEAELVLQIIKGLKFEYPIYFDTEDNHDVKGAGCSPTSQYTIGKGKLTKVAKAFLETIENAGYYAGIYASTSWLNNQLDISQLKDYDVWVAHYGVDKPTYKGSYGMWQYTSSGKIDGISGNVDLNWCYKDYPAIIKKAGLNGYTTSETKPETSEIEKLEQELVETKKALETAEKSLSEAQAEVTRLKKKVNEARAILNAN